MKKFSVILIAVLCMTMAFAVASSAAGLTGSASRWDADTEAYVATETAFAGDKVEVKISLADYAGTGVNNVQIRVALPEGAVYVEDSAKILLTAAEAGGINYSAKSNAIIFQWTDIMSAIPEDEPDLFSFEVMIPEDATAGLRYIFTPEAEVFQQDTLDAENPINAEVTAVEVEIVDQPQTGDATVIAIAVIAVAAAATLVLKKRENA